MRLGLLWFNEIYGYQYLYKMLQQSLAPLWWTLWIWEMYPTSSQIFGGAPAFKNQSTPRCHRFLQKRGVVGTNRCHHWEDSGEISGKPDLLHQTWEFPKKWVKLKQIQGFRQYPSQWWRNSTILDICIAMLDYWEICWITATRVEKLRHGKPVCYN